MGADIHFFIEVKEPTENVWVEAWLNEESSKYYSGNRNYATFALLAGVRGKQTEINDYDNDIVYTLNNPLFEVKFGIPDDSCPEVVASFETWSYDGHSHSFFTLQDLEKIDLSQIVYPKKIDLASLVVDNINDTSKFPTLGKLLENNTEIMEIYNLLSKIKEDYKVSSENIRFIYWFDN